MRELTSVVTNIAAEIGPLGGANSHSIDSGALGGSS